MLVGVGNGVLVGTGAVTVTVGTAVSVGETDVAAGAQEIKTMVTSKTVMSVFVVICTLIIERFVQ
jgi:hypothetical protein